MAIGKSAQSNQVTTKGPARLHCVPRGLCAPGGPQGGRWQCAQISREADPRAGDWGICLEGPFGGGRLMSVDEIENKLLISRIQRTVPAVWEG